MLNVNVLDYKTYFFAFFVIGCVDGHYHSQCIIARLSTIVFRKLIIFR